MDVDLFRRTHDRLASLLAASLADAEVPKMAGNLRSMAPALTSLRHLVTERHRDQPRRLTEVLRAIQSRALETLRATERTAEAGVAALFSCVTAATLRPSLRDASALEEAIAATGARLERGPDVRGFVLDVFVLSELCWLRCPPPASSDLPIAEPEIRRHECRGVILLEDSAADQVGALLGALHRLDHLRPGRWARVIDGPFVDGDRFGP